MTLPPLAPADRRADVGVNEVPSLFGLLLPPDPGALQTFTQLAPAGGRLWFAGTRFTRGLEAGPQPAAGVLDGGRVQVLADGARLVAVHAARDVAALVHGNDRVDWVREHDAAPLGRWLAPGRVESVAWSPSGRTLLLLVAGLDADASGREGGVPLRAEPGSDWMPLKLSGMGDAWRRLWLWSAADAEPQPLTRPPLNAWEACWAGNDAVAVVASDGCQEDDWFSATPRLLGLQDGAGVTLHRPAEQVGGMAASSDGRLVAWIEALASDRGLVCGTVHLAQVGAPPVVLPLADLQATQLAFRDGRHLLVAGLQGLDSVVAEVALGTGVVNEHWRSADEGVAGWLPTAWPAPGGGAYTVIEGPTRPPSVVHLHDGRMRVLHAATPSQAPPACSTRALRWPGADGTTIEGLLMESPPGTARPAAGRPLYVDIHGGPVFAHRARWPFHLRADALLVQAGWVVLLPNPRGSAGRGQRFARAVVADMGGADLNDVLAGIDHLVGAGVADPRRVAAGGTSYGGFLTAALVVHTRRLAAAVPISPVTDWYHQHFASQAPWFDRHFLGADPAVPGGPYHARSPVFHAAGATTPTLTMAGARDRNAPPGQALAFHQALLAAGATSRLLLYPRGGHSLRTFPEYLDSAAEIVAWLRQHAGP